MYFTGNQKELQKILKHIVFISQEAKILNILECFTQKIHDPLYSEVKLLNFKKNVKIIAAIWLLFTSWLQSNEH